jgi:cell wall-associated NlpC family hydrolase
MPAIAAHIHRYRLWPTLPMLLCVVLYLTACARHAKPPAVAPRPPAPIQPLPPVAQPALPAIQFTVQVGAFSTSARAAAYADHLQAAGVDAYYFIDVDQLYKVRLERFDNREAALARGLELQTRALIDAFFIVHPQPEQALPDPPLALGESIVRTAHRFIGTAYRWGGTSAEKGFDCSGLTMTVYRLNGLDLPRTALQQYRAGTPVAKEARRPGDLVFFATDGTRRISHVGIYSGQGQFIHAPSRGNAIRSASLDNSYFASRYKGARRYF